MQKTLRSITCGLIGATALAGCAGTGNPLKGASSFRYDHVANAHQVRLAKPLQSPDAQGQVSVIDPADPKGFWAIFLVCSLDVNDDAFDYSARNFQVEYRSERFGPIKSETVRLKGVQELNQPAQTPALADAIADEIHTGPVTRRFESGIHRPLNYRVAVFVPHGLAAYNGEPLSLRYVGQEAIVIGGDYDPVDLPAIGGDPRAVRSKCRG